MESNLETLSGTLERITFQSEETGFGIFKVNCKGIRDLVTITGVCAVIHVGEYIEATGYWFNDKKYGRQFKSHNIEVVQPHTLEGITKYLGSGLIKGIGPAFAKVLVKGFGDSIFDVIEQTPNKLLELEGIGPKRVETIVNAWDEQKSVRNIMVYLQSHGVGTARATRIYKKYGDDAIEKIKANPYCLAKDIHGIGFKTADQLALNIGIPHDSVIRAQAGVLHVIQEINSDGHCAIEKAKLIKASEEMLDIHSSIIEEAIELEKQSESLIPEIINDKDCLYINWLYYAEVGIASNILRLLDNQRRWQIDNIDAALEWVQKQTGLKLSDSQQQAVRMAISNKIVCITGGPGVGKPPYILNKNVLENVNFNVFEEAKYFEELNPRAITLTVQDDKLIPVCKVGDLIGGIQVDEVEFNNDYIITKLNNEINIYKAKSYIDRNVHVLMDSRNEIQEIVQFKVIEYFYKIVWVRSYL